MRSKLAILLLLASGWTSVHSDDQKPKLYTVFGNLSADFVTTLQTIESPANRWKPGEEPLPVDVAEFARRAKQHLLRRRPELPASANLIAMEISPFTTTTVSPKGALESAAKHKQEAWYLVFVFSNRLPDGKQLSLDECTVGMMLNGTFLEMVKKGAP